jgi:short-subunit dehydrogenase
MERVVQLNVIAVMRLSGAVVPGFVARGVGTLINIASVLALAPEILNGIYSGTKAFVLNLSQSLNHELGAKGVRVQVVLPGATRTEIFQRSGHNINDLPAEMLMEVDEMVDASLKGLDLGETVTILCLPDIKEWEDYNAARLALTPKLSRQHAAVRYR